MLLDATVVFRRPVNFWSAGGAAFFRCALFDVAEQVLVRDLHGLAIKPGVLQEFVVVIGGLESFLASRFVQIQRPALRSEIDASLSLEECDLEGLFGL